MGQTCTICGRSHLVYQLFEIGLAALAAAIVTLQTPISGLSIRGSRHMSAYHLAFCPSLGVTSSSPSSLLPTRRPHAQGRCAEHDISREWLVNIEGGGGFFLLSRAEIMHSHGSAESRFEIPHFLRYVLQCRLLEASAQQFR
jgi:hypothetical protein